MSDYINEAFARMDLWQIRAFILHGTEQYKQSDEPYDVQLKKATAPIYSRLESLYPNQSDLTQASNDMSKALSAYEEVYMELGMKLGARLLYQLLLKDDKSHKLFSKLGT